MFVIIYNFLLVSLLLLFFEVLGHYVANKLFGRTFSLNIFIGFLAYMALFELICAIPMILHFPFGYVSYIVILLTLVLMVFMFKCNGKQALNNILDNKNYLLLYVALSFLFSLYVIFESIAVSDSWIYMPLTLSSIQNGIIYSNSGNGLVTNFNANHVLDSFYLFQSMLASISWMDPFLYVMSIFRFIEVFVIFGTFAVAFDILFPKYKNYILIIVCTSLFFGISLFTSYVTFYEINYTWFRIMSNGTLLMNTMFILTLFLYYYLRDEKTNNLVLLALLTLAGFALNSSTIFVICFFLISLAVLDIFVEKNSRYIKYYIVPVYCISIYFSLSFIVKEEKILSLVVFLLCAFVLSIFFRFLYKLFARLNFFIIRKVIGIFLGLYFLGAFSVLVLNNATLYLLLNIYTLNFTGNFTINDGYYFDFYSTIFVAGFVILGLFKIYRENHKFFIYVIITLILNANIFIYNSYGVLIGREVFHRVFNLPMFNIIVIFGLIYMVERFCSYTKVKIKYLFLVIPVFFIMFASVSLRSDFKDFINFRAFKFGDNNIEQLYQFDFSQSNLLSISSVASSVSHLEQNVSMIFQYRTDLQIIPFCDRDCYALYKKGVNYDGILVLETEDYILVYKGEK